MDSSFVEVTGNDLVVGCVYQIHLKFWYGGKVIPNGGIKKYARFEKSEESYNTPNPFYYKKFLPQIVYCFRLLENNVLMYTYTYHPYCNLKNTFHIEKNEIPFKKKKPFSLLNLSMFNTSTKDLQEIRKHKIVPFINNYI